MLIPCSDGVSVVLPHIQFDVHSPAGDPPVGPEVSNIE
jgi:hypothetical protein